MTAATIIALLSEAHNQATVAWVNFDAIDFNTLDDRSRMLIADGLTHIRSKVGAMQTMMRRAEKKRARP